MRKILRIKVGQMTEEDWEQGIGSRCQSVLTPLRQGCVEDGVPQPCVDGWPGANLDLNAS